MRLLWQVVSRHHSPLWKSRLQSVRWQWKPVLTRLISYWHSMLSWKETMRLPLTKSELVGRQWMRLVRVKAARLFSRSSSRAAFSQLLKESLMLRSSLWNAAQTSSRPLPERLMSMLLRWLLTSCASASASSTRRQAARSVSRLPVVFPR